MAGAVVGYSHHTTAKRLWKKKELGATNSKSNPCQGTAEVFILAYANVGRLQNLHMYAGICKPSPGGYSPPIPPNLSQSLMQGGRILAFDRNDHMIRIT